MNGQTPRSIVTSHDLNTDPTMVPLREFVGRSLGLSVGDFELRALPGATQAQVWSVRTLERRERFVLRVVGRPLDLLRRQAGVLDTASERGSRVARILSVQSYDDSVSQVCEWMPGDPPHLERDRSAWLIGQQLATFHQSTAGLEDQLADRRLELLSPRHLIEGEVALGERVQSLVRIRRRALTRWSDHFQHLVPNGVIHGDVHKGNVMMSGQAAGLIDFDKMMIGPRVFDLAKYIATSCFRGTAMRPILQRGPAEAIVSGYESVLPLSQVERASINSLCVLLVAETETWGRKAGIDDLLRFADRSARWFGSTPRRTTISMALAQKRDVSPTVLQMPLFEDETPVHHVRTSNIGDVTGVQLHLGI